MITPDPSFRPNPKRAIYVQGVIDQQLVDRITPNLILLQSECREPITVYIDSPGGSVYLTEAVLKLLTASNQDFAPSCRLITVVTAQAASAAADLLSSGDYALAYPDSSLLYHGVRLSEERPLTAETTSMLAQMLRARNDSYAMELARKIEYRFMFRFMTSKSQFESIRRANQPSYMTDLDCFLSLLSDKVSASADRVLTNARQRYGRYDELIDSVLRKRGKRPSKPQSLAQFEANEIKAIVDFEVRSNKQNKNWSFEWGGGMSRLTDDFFLLCEHLNTFRSERFKRLCSHWGNFLLGEAELEEINKAPVQERPEKMLTKVSPLLRPVWSFFVALCHSLQEGENDLTARDAFWLGLIDEVIGVRELPSSRLLSEYSPDQSAGPRKNEKDEAKAEEQTSATGA